MSRIFISYAREDASGTAKIADWLSKNGWADEVFIDTDPKHGISGGQAWREALRNAAERCEAVLVLLSHSWLDSPVCRSEFRLAESFGKAIIPIKLEAETSFDEIPSEIKDRYQIIDRGLSSDAEFYQRLRRALIEAGAGPASFPLPADAQPYFGLRALKENDAALFFGRDPEVLQSIECIRQIRATGQRRILVILGGSGTGKSSLLRAGIWPRINRDDRNYLVLPTIRPGNAALSGDEGFWRSFSSGMSDRRWTAHLASSMPTTSRGVAETVEDVGIVEVVEQFRRAAAQTLLHKGEPPSIVVPIDQAEELFNNDGQQESDHFLTLARELLNADPRTILVLSLRSDMLARLQEDVRIPQSEVQLFNLPPMPLASLPQVISGPAERLGIEVEPAMIPRLLEDARGADALPLLALTLKNVYDERRIADKLTIDDYEHIGGVRKAIEETANRAREKALGQGVNGGDYSEILRRVFIPHLVRINEAEEPARRTALWSDFQTDEAKTVVSTLVDQRLLVSDTTAQTRTVEIAHEAVLRTWPEIVRHVRKHRDFLKWLDQIHDLRAAYIAQRGDLLTGRALAIALDFRDSFGDTLKPDLLDYINTSEEEAEKQRSAALREAEEKARSARRTTRMFAGLTALLLVAAIGAGGALKRARDEEQRALQEANRSESLRLAAIASDINQRDDAEAARHVAWMALPHDSALQDRPITNEAATAFYQEPTRKIFEGLRDAVTSYAPDGNDLLVTSFKEGRVRLLNVITGLPVLDTQIRNWSDFGESYAHGYYVAEDPETLTFDLRLPFPEFTADGRNLVLFHGDGTIDIHRRTDGALMRQIDYDSTTNRVILSTSGNRLLVESMDGALRVVDLAEDSPPLALTRVVKAEDEIVLDDLTVTGLIDDQGLRDTMWLEEKTRRSYPIYSFINKNTGVEGAELFIGNTGVFAVEPNGSGLIFGCGLNNDAFVYSLKDISEATKKSDGDLTHAGLYRFVVRENEIRLVSEENTETDDYEGNTTIDCAVSGDGTVAVLNSFDRVALFDMTTGVATDVTGRYSPFPTSTLLWNDVPLGPHSKRYGPVGLNYNGTVIYGLTGSVLPGEGELVFHNVATGQLLSRIEPRHGIQAYDVDRDASTAVIDSEDGTISVWDVASGARLFALPSQAQAEDVDDSYMSSYKTVNLDPSGRSFIIKDDVSVDVYRNSPFDATPIRSDPAFRVAHVLGSEDGIVLGTAKGELQRRATNGQMIATHSAHQDAVKFLETDANGNIISTGWDGRLIKVNAKTLEELASVQAHPLGISALAVAPNKSMIATASYDSQVALWDSALQGSPIRFVNGFAAVSDIVFTDDGRHFVTGDEDGVIKLWNAEAGTELAKLGQFDGPVWSMARIPGRNVVVATGGYGTTRAWSITDGGAKLIWTLSSNERVRALAAAPNGAALALGMSDGRALLIANPDRANAAELNENIEFTGHRGPIVSMTFLGDGRLMATGAEDRSTRIWDVETARQVAVYDGAGSTLLSVATDLSGAIATTLFSENLVEVRQLSESSLAEKIRVFNEIATADHKIPKDICDQYQLWSFPRANAECAKSD